MRDGIPDDAFKPIEGDDKKLCAEYKKQNRDERRGQKMLPFEGTAKPWERMGDLATALANLDDQRDDTVDAVRRKQERYAQLVSSTSYLSTHFWADTWCAAFVWKKTKEFDYAITEEVFRRIERNPHDCPPWMREEIQRLARQYQFFHWHLAFPQVFRVPVGDEEPENEQTGWSGGFDAVLGNPPWEKIQVEEQGFFSSHAPEIAAMRGARRKSTIRELVTDNPSLYRDWLAHKRTIGALDHSLKNTGRFPLAGNGKMNTYAIFVELGHSLIHGAGNTALIVPLGFVTDHGSKELFGFIAGKGFLRCVFGFENEEFIFPTVHHAFKFCIFCASGQSNLRAAIDLAFFCRQVSDLLDRRRHFELHPADILLLNPNTQTCPIFRSRRDFHVTRTAYERFQIIDADARANAWRVAIHRIFNSTDDSALMFRLESDENRPPRSLNDGQPVHAVYEGKMFHQFDHRFGTYVGQTAAQERQGKLPELTTDQHSDPHLYAQPRYWMASADTEKRLEPHLGQRRWLLAFRDVASPVVFRTAIASVLPRVPTVDYRCVFFPDEVCIQDIAGFLGAFNSFVFDYIGRQKFSGNHLSTFIVRQLPIPSPGQFMVRDALSTEDIQARALELTYTAWDLEPFANDCGYEGPPFCWDEDRRFLLRCELDAFYFHLYGIGREDVDYIMETFPIVKERDVEEHGTYRTKDQILAIYDMMAEAIQTGRPYQTLLDPPPADPRVAHPPREPVEVRPVREAVAMATVDTAFPSSDRDKWLCAVMLDLVEVDPGRATAAYLDAMWLATHPDRCATLLTGSDQSSFRSVARSVPKQLAEEAGATMPWRDLCDTLLGNRSLQDASGGRLSEIVVGENCQAVRAQFGSLPSSFVVSVAKAAERLRELQAGAVPADEQTAALLSEAQQWRDTVIQS